MSREAKLILTSENRATAGISGAKSDLLGLEAAAKKAGDTLRNAFTVLALVDAGRKIARFGADCATAFGEAQRTMLQLSAAVGGSSSRFANLTDLMERMTRRTTSSKDEIEALVAELASLGKSDADIERITEAAVNLSNVTGKSLNDSFMAINGTYTGTLGKLEKLVPELGSMTSAQLQAGGAVDALNAKLGKITDTMSTGYAQSITNMKNTWDDFKEAIGSNLEPLFSPMLRWMQNIVGKWAEGLLEYKKYRDAIKKDSEARTAEENLTIAQVQRKDLLKAQDLKARQAGIDTSQRGQGSQYARFLAGSAEAPKIAALDLEIMALKAELDKLEMAANAAVNPAGKPASAPGAAAPPVLTPAAAEAMVLPIVEAVTYNPFAYAPSPDSYAPAEASPYFGPAAAKPSMLDGLLGKLTGGFGSLLTSLASVQQILDPIGTVLSGVFEVIGPLISEALAPLVGLLKIFGNIIGKVLAPVITVLATIIKGLASVFVWLANLIIIPVGNLFIAIMRGIISALNAIPGVNIKKPAYLQAFSLGDAAGAGDSTTTGAGGKTGTGASYTGAQSIIFNFYNQGNVVGSGGLEELAALINSIIVRQARYA
jgi:hypothetical protein